MSLELLDTPTRDILPGIFSLHSAAHNAVLFKFRRKDFLYNATASSGAGLTTTFTLTAAMVNPFIVGNLVYVKSLAGTSYDQAATIVSVPDSTHVELNIPYLGSSTSGFINSDDLLVNFYLQIKIEKLDPGTLLVQSVIAEPLFRPEANGNIRADISAYLKSGASNENPFSYYNLVNTSDAESGGVYKVSYRYNYIGTVNSYSDIDRFYWVNSAKQILDIYSGNMAEFVPQIYNTIGTPDIIKFLTDFETPTYFPGYPFDLSFIYWDETPEVIDAADVVRVREFYDINMVPISTSYSTLDKNFKNNVNRLLIEDPQAGGIDHLPAGTKFLDVWLDNGVGLTPPSGWTVCSVDPDPGQPDGYIYHSIERTVGIGSYFRIDVLEINGISVLPVPVQEITIASPSDIHNTVGLNGSIQFRNLTDLVNAITTPLGLTFFDDMAVVWKDPTVLSFLIIVHYKDPLLIESDFSYDQTGFFLPGSTSADGPYNC